jgi:(1->4)-alpha-D-glucan 1-alpha-D-glucosylmutase
MNHPSIPTATYRVQLRKEFTFAQTEALAGYLRDLGISHLYTSPFFKAAPGSTHGYDISDHNQLNPELGSPEEFDRMAGAMRDASLGILVDFVPNHMGIADSGNAWWMDVLEHGQASPFAQYFDIDWRPLKRELEHKVLLPILGDQYGRILESGDLKLQYQDGIFTLHYWETTLPVDPCSIQMILQRAATMVRGKIAEEDQLEFQSIITSLEHLPPATSLDRDKIAERAREQMVVKRRLKTIAEKTPAVGAALEAAVAELQVKGDPRAHEQFDALLQAQNYRLSYWRVAGEEINYRRFFDINALAAIRMELPEVFDAAHRLVFELIRDHKVHGLRIDHVDGLYDPREYLQKLQSRAAKELGLPSSAGAVLYVVVEKILERDEHLRTDWLCHGTTGYEFGNQVLGVLVDHAQQKTFTETYERFTGVHERFDDIVYESKLLVMRSAMASEVNVLGHMLNRLSETNRWYRDFTLNALTTAVREVIACFPVYRTYITPDGSATEVGRRVIDRAISLARRRNPSLERTVFSFLREVLLPTPNSPHQVDEQARCEFVMKFQQCSGPITAKGVEDTAFYRYHRLIALNEVGGDPGLFGTSVESFHAQNAARRAEFPHTMVATSTHDTKRSEDVRMRIAAISELPKEWAQHVKRWQTANRKHLRTVDGEPAPSPLEEYLIYQTLIGSWPLELLEDASPETFEDYPYQQYIERLQGYLVKALHEAKQNSSWIEPNQAWDQGVQEFIAAILDRAKNARFLNTFVPIATRLAQLGAINSLAELVLKGTVPGVPDIYQGNEIWDLSLVDPDNRRPVDYEHRARLLAGLGDQPNPEELMAAWADGRIKLFVTRALLHFRRANPGLFGNGSYTPLEATGEFGSCVIAFQRQHENQRLAVVVPRLTARIGFPPLGDLWKDTALKLAGRWRNLFTGDTVEGESLPLADVLRRFPVAVLVGE